MVFHASVCATLLTLYAVLLFLQELRDMLAPYGAIRDLCVYGTHAFVQMASVEEAQRAMAALHAMQRIMVSHARIRVFRTPGRRR